MKAQCLCKKIEFEFEPQNNLALNCHCSLCRRSHGAAFATQLFSSKSSLRFISGKQDLKEYNSPKGIRAFCSNCGSRLMNYARDEHDYMSVALSAVVGEHEIKPSLNIFIGSKASWYEPTESIKSYEGLPEGLE